MYMTLVVHAVLDEKGKVLSGGKVEVTGHKYTRWTNICNETDYKDKDKNWIHLIRHSNKDYDMNGQWDFCKMLRLGYKRLYYKAIDTLKKDKYGNPIIQMNLVNEGATFQGSSYCTSNQNNTSIVNTCENWVYCTTDKNDDINPKCKVTYAH